MAVYELARDGCTKAEVINRLGISMTVFKKNYKDEWTEGLKAKAAHAMEVWRESRESRQLDEALLPSPSLSPETDSDSNLPGEEKTKVTRKMGEKSMHAAAVLQEMLARGMKLAPITGKEAGNHFRTRLGDNVITIQKLADESKVSFAVAQKIIAKYRKSIAPDREFVLDPVETGLTREEILDYQAQKAHIELEMPNSQE
ncbi:MAG: hypothetical protein OXF23_05015, partial [Candidatus Dadabacteria bacterium]|nr:hypothetical protein [Candidatus Dadabacteria bacterium]